MFTPEGTHMVWAPTRHTVFSPRSPSSSYNRLSPHSGLFPRSGFAPCSGLSPRRGEPITGPQGGGPWTF
jgi:hypothetical protein